MKMKFAHWVRKHQETREHVALQRVVLKALVGDALEQLTDDELLEIAKKVAYKISTWSPKQQYQVLKAVDDFEEALEVNRIVAQRVRENE